MGKLLDNMEKAGGDQQLKRNVLERADKLGVFLAPKEFVIKMKMIQKKPIIIPALKSKFGLELIKEKKIFDLCDFLLNL